MINTLANTRTGSEKTTSINELWLNKLESINSILERIKTLLNNFHQFLYGFKYETTKLEKEIPTPDGGIGFTADLLRFLNHLQQSSLFLEELSQNLTGSFSIPIENANNHMDTRLDPKYLKTFADM
jgi:hypothetical protein